MDCKDVVYRKCCKKCLFLIISERFVSRRVGARDPHGGVQQHAGLHGVAGAADAAAAPAERAAGEARPASSLHRAVYAYHAQVCTYTRAYVQRSSHT